MKPQQKVDWSCPLCGQHITTYRPLTAPVMHTCKARGNRRLVMEALQHESQQG